MDNTEITKVTLNKIIESMESIDSITLKSCTMSVLVNAISLCSYPDNVDTSIYKWMKSNEDYDEMSMYDRKVRFDTIYKDLNKLVKEF